MPRLTVLLPCLNEELALPELFKQLQGVHVQLQPRWELGVLVVDDGSTDGTAKVVQREWDELPVTLVQHDGNRGLGSAIATGVAWFLQQSADDDALAVMDADLTHPPALLAEMLGRLAGDGPAAANLRTPPDVVIASRYAPGGKEHGLVWWRRAMSRLVSIGFRFMGRVPGARDYSCGYRLYRRDVLARVKERFGDALITERGFTCMAELLVKLGRAGAQVAEVPLVLHYELKRGESKLKVAATIKRYVVLAWQVLFDPHWR